MLPQGSPGAAAAAAAAPAASSPSAAAASPATPATPAASPRRRALLSSQSVPRFWRRPHDHPHRSSRATVLPCLSSVFALSGSRASVYLCICAPCLH